MTLLASLTNRIFIAASLLAIVTTAVAVYVVGLRATREAELELARGLAEAGDLVDQQQRALTASRCSRQDCSPTCPSSKARWRRGMPRRSRPLPPITGARWPPICSSFPTTRARGLPPMPAGAGAPTAEAVTAALGGREVVEFRPDAGGVLQVATVPIAIGLESPDVLGAVSVGVRLDAQMAERFKRATRSEVAFTLDGAVRAATVPQSTWPALQPLLSQPAVSQILIGDSEYVGRAQPLGASESGEARPMAGAAVPGALVLQSRTERLGFLRTVYAALALAAATAVLLAVGLSYAVARTITRPLAAITATMREVAATGDLTRKIPLREPSAWQDEDARLLATTFNTLTDSVARFQREAVE